MPRRFNSEKPAGPVSWTELFGTSCGIVILQLVGLLDFADFEVRLRNRGYRRRRGETRRDDARTGDHHFISFLCLGCRAAEPSRHRQRSDANGCHQTWLATTHANRLRLLSIHFWSPKAPFRRVSMDGFCWFRCGDRRWSFVRFGTPGEPGTDADLVHSEQGCCPAIRASLGYGIHTPSNAAVPPTRPARYLFFVLPFCWIRSLANLSVHSAKGPMARQ